MSSMPAPHPVEFRQRAVELARTGDKPVAALAKDLGISESCLRNWMAQADADDGARADRLTTAEKKELAELRRRNRRDGPMVHDHHHDPPPRPPPTHLKPLF